MTNTGMFVDADRIIYLENQNKLLKKKLREAVKIDKEHQELNGKLHVEIEALKKDNEILYEGNERLDIYRK
jgi:hypothetical protein